MKIVADENIPLVEYYFGQYGELILKAGRAITAQDVKDADILLVRSVTPVNSSLLQGSSVKFVGSATTGMDHLDLAWLKQNNIAYSIAKGCNARAVVEYIICTIAALQNDNFLLGQRLRAAVIGVGEIGQQVADALSVLGFEVVLCDPYRKDIQSTSLDKLADVDLITLHVPLTKQGDYPTYHMINKEFLRRQKKNCVLINSSRGAVVDFNDLKLYGENLLWCLDVWENEPNIDAEVLDLALIATPHIAGYSVQSKYRGIEMIFADAKKIGIMSGDILPIIYPAQNIAFNGKSDWRNVVLHLFNPLTYTAKMKNALVEDMNAFDVLRKNFNERNEFAYVKVENAKLATEDQDLLSALGFGLA